MHDGEHIQFCTENESHRSNRVIIICFHESLFAYWFCPLCHPRMNILQPLLKFTRCGCLYVHAYELFKYRNSDVHTLFVESNESNITRNLLNKTRSANIFYTSSFSLCTDTWPFTLSRSAYNIIKISGYQLWTSKSRYIRLLIVERKFDPSILVHIILYT